MYTCFYYACTKQRAVMVNCFCT